MDLNDMFYVYVLKSKKDNNLYTGFTGNLKERFKQHNAKRCLSTKQRAPFDLIYYEACLNKRDAEAREKYLKSGMGKRYIKNRLTNYFQN
jgi:putative endonuclease